MATITKVDAALFAGKKDEPKAVGYYHIFVFNSYTQEWENTGRKSATWSGAEAIRAEVGGQTFSEYRRAPTRKRRK